MDPSKKQKIKPVSPEERLSFEGESLDQPEVNKRIVEGTKLCIENPSDAVKKALEGVSEDDPAVALEWHSDALRNAVERANDLHAQQQAGFVMAPWMMGAAFPIAVLQLQMGIIRHLSEAGSGQSIGTWLLAPNNMKQSFGIQQRVRDLMIADQFLGAICGPAPNHPIARIYVLADGRRPTNADHIPPIELPAGYGVAVFD